MDKSIEITPGRRYISTQHTLLGGEEFYGDEIPQTITIKTTTTGDELEKCAAEAFHNTMIEQIFPRCIEPKFNFRKLLELDYMGILRKMLITSCGPFVKPSVISCPDCGAIIKDSETLASIENVDVTPIPDGMGDCVVCPSGELLYCDDEIHLRFTRVSHMLGDAALLQKLRQKNQNISKDYVQYELSMNRLAHMLISAGEPGSQKPFMDLNFAMSYLRKLDANDVRMLAKFYTERTAFGDSSVAKTICPSCHGPNAEFHNVINAYSFRPSMEQLTAWRDLRRSESKAVSGDAE